jgi:nucleotide-binding universal stress UspA family protein
MIDWKRICCAIDFGAPSRVALERAADLAKRFDAELTLVHVLVPPPPAASDVLVSSRGVMAAEAEENEEMLPVWRADAERRIGRSVHARLLSGDAATEIVKHARGERFDLVVIGTHGRTGIPHLVLGSVAERVARQCPCPVLVVHDHAVLEQERIAEEAAEYR